MFKVITLTLAAGLLAACQTAPKPIDYAQLTDLQKACQLPQGQTAPSERLVSKSYRTSDSKDLVVLLHGRSAIALKGQPDASLAAKRAERLARDGGGATVVAIARPGFRMQGEKSPGDAFGGSDSATAYNSAWVANEIAALKSELGADRVTLVGDSEGGLTAAAIAACRPELVDHLLLGRCPCDLAQMRKTVGDDALFVRSPSPIALVDHFDKDLIVRITTAPNDKQTPIPLAFSFLEAASVKVDAQGFFKGEKEGHGWSKVRDYLTEQVRVLTSR